MDKTSNEEMQMPPGVGPTTAVLVVAIVAAGAALVVGTIAKSGARLGAPASEVAR
ncbi:MAG TPA: hypothetical protein VN903_00790 [Polyangia bacterium]|jgi:hypothetical protein|nr:hypothetical protein [Polyangia bacterium]